MQEGIGGIVVKAGLDCHNEGAKMVYPTLDGNDLRGPPANTESNIPQTRAGWWERGLSETNGYRHILTILALPFIAKGMKEEGGYCHASQEDPFLH